MRHERELGLRAPRKRVGVACTAKESWGCVHYTKGLGVETRS